MPFTLPTFNLSCKIIAGRFPGGFITTTCNLAFSRRNKEALAVASVLAAPMTHSFPVYILLPIGTDVRGGFETGGNRDQIEVVVGSGRIYSVFQVEDAGKGFANAHRVAICFQVAAWPVPIP